MAAGRMPVKLVCPILAALSSAAPGFAETDGPRWVRLAAIVFDPLAEGEPDLAGSLPHGPVLRSEGGGVRPAQLIQLDGPVTRAARSRIESHGLEVLGYLPDRTLIVRPAAGAGAQAVEAVSDRRWSGPYSPGYKLSPDLRRLIGLEVVSTAEAIAIDAVLFRGEDPHSLARAVAQRFESARVIHVLDGAVVRVAIETPPEILWSLVGALLRDDAVEFVSRRLPLELHNDNSVWIGQSYDRVHGPPEAAEPDPKPYTLSASIWSRGLTGAGQIVAVSDTGLEHGMCFFDDPRQEVVPQTVRPPAPLALDLGHRKLLAYNAPHPAALLTDDTFRHGTHTAASAVGDDLDHLAGPGAGHDHGDGMAPAAKLIFEDISGAVSSTCSTKILVDSVLELFQQEHASGARLSSNSWGSSGEALAFDVTSLEADAAIWAHQDFAAFVSAGNKGGGGLVGLATCKNCVSVGATENYDASFSDAFGILDPENMAAFSSRGPTADGRIKPDITAPGYLVESARFPVTYYGSILNPACDPEEPGVCLPGFGGCYVADTAQTCHTDLLLGTSMATPITAGLGALARQYFTEGFYPTGAATLADAREPSAALLKALLINGGRNMTGRLYERRGTPVDFGPLADAPSGVQGWGRIQLEDALYFTGDARRLQVVDVPDSSGLAAGESIELQFTAIASRQPLKLTLAWSDPPQAPAAATALVNDLDLTLTTPGGAVFRGNQFTPDDLNVPGDKESAPSPSGKDALNNVEGILLRAPAAGLYTVAIHGADVPGGTLQQGAALVVTGAIAECTGLEPPLGLVAVASGGARVDLAWEPVPAALGYRILRNGTSCGAPMAMDHVLNVPAGETSFADLTVEPQVTYHYTVRAVVSAEGCQTADGNCATVTTPAPGPPPVPDGTFGSPLRASRADGAGSAIDLEWDVAGCPAPGYHLLYGPLGGVAGPELGGAVCELRTSGTFSWLGAPPGDLWFLVVGDDGVATEGNWGMRSDGFPRGGAAPSTQCGMASRDNTGSCTEPSGPR